MTYYQSSDEVTIYEPSARAVTISDNIRIGMVVRFSHPDYTYNGIKCVEFLELNKTYSVQDYMIYMDGVAFTLANYPGIQFDSKMFTLESNNYIIPCGRRRTKFYFEKKRIKIKKWLCRR